MFGDEIMVEHALARRLALEQDLHHAFQEREVAADEPEPVQQAAQGLGAQQRGVGVGDEDLVGVGDPLALPGAAQGPEEPDPAAEGRD